MKRYDSYKDSGVEWIGEIPSHWEIIKGKYILKILTGNYPSEIIEDENGQHFVKVDDLNFLEDDFYLSNPKLKIQDFGMNTLEEGIILFPKRGMTIFTNKVVITKSKCFIDPNLMGVKVFDSFNKIFLFYFLTNRGLGDICDSSTIPQINNKHIYPLEFTNPPVSEQQQIVSFLDTKTSLIDSLIEKTQRKIELLKEKRTTLINEVVTKGLNPNVEMKDSGVEWIGEIPSHWNRNKLNRISERIGDGLHSTPKYVDSSEFFFINGNNLVDGKIKIFNSTKCVSEEEFNKHFIQLNSKTILLSINGTIGNLSYYNNEKVILGKSSCYINLKENINHNFIYYVLKSESINKYFTFELTGSTIFNLSLNSIRNTPIVIPSEKEQQQIVEYLDEQTQKIDKIISIEEKRIKLLKEYRQSLISEVVTGKRKVV